jgi:murein DD-endopeptidase MepM/ murein hydrolase activator NlpD
LPCGIFFGVIPGSSQDDGLSAALGSLNGYVEEPYLVRHPYGPVRHLADTTVAAEDWDFDLWNNKVFDPYKEEVLDYPFHVSFPEKQYHAPIDRKMVVTSRYGWRNGELHRGIDIDLESGDDVRSIFDGKVRYVKSHAGHGKTVVIRHRNGLESVYAHLSKQLVKENDIVRKGQVIGKGGTTGNARGSHLHFEVRYLGRTINPEYFFEFEEGTNVRALSLWVTPEKTDPRQYSSDSKKKLLLIRNVEELEEKTELVSMETVEPAIDIDAKINKASAEVTTNAAVPAVNTVNVNNEDEKIDSDDTYIIKYGDTIYSLARKYQVKIEDLCSVNGIADSFKIKVGQKIKVRF